MARYQTCSVNLKFVYTHVSTLSRNVQSQFKISVTENPNVGPEYRHGTHLSDHS